ncbi:MAG: hypothetical protein SV487_07820 [Thermodesulfobacteriota bacterium]|nr:hypothetical protein [Thermodesulfobacteriota bacterium]
MKKKFLPLIFVFILLYGCGIKGKAVSPAYDLKKSYELNEIYSANVGCPIIIVQHTHSYPVYSPKKFELIYNGIRKNIVIIDYREYKDNMTKVTYCQELKHDLTESNIITFRSIKITVLKADNSRIKFIVTDDGGLPWVSLKISY